MRDPLEPVDRHGSRAKLIVTRCALEDVARAPCKEAWALGGWNSEDSHADSECEILSLAYAQGVCTGKPDFCEIVFFPLDLAAQMPAPCRALSTTSSNLCVERPVLQRAGRAAVSSTIPLPISESP